MKTWVGLLPFILGVDVHVTVNTLVKEKEIESLKEYLKQLNKIGVDAFIVQDMGAVEIIKKTVSGYDFTRKHADDRYKS